MKQEEITSMKRITSAAALIALLAGFCLVRGPHAALAQQEEKDASIWVYTQCNEDSLKQQLVMVYLIHDGKVVKSTETRTNTEYNPVQWGVLPIGIYEVKIEGEGAETFVKRGIILTHNNTTQVTFPLKAGQGIHIIEYPTGAVSKDDIATRLAKLEAAQCNCGKK
jgi:hypothetical protein